MHFIYVFPEGAPIRESLERTYNLTFPRVPVTFDLGEDKHLQEIEEVNGVENVPSKAKWIKPIGRRRVCVGKHVANNSLFIDFAMLWACNIEPGKDENGNVIRLTWMDV